MPLELKQIDRKLFDGLSARFHPAYPLLTHNFLGWVDKTTPYFLADNPADPRVLCVHSNISFMLYGDYDAQVEIVRQILAEALGPAWPNDETRIAWEKEERKYFDLNTIGIELHDELARMGLTNLDPKEKEGAYFYYIEGEPRFSHRVRHECLIKQGQELFDLMRRSVTYDESGEYTKQCLDKGPSFLCVDNGEPVCWSCTHVNGMLGMIFTPEEHRRKGYARSLAAFQIDYMLKRDGYTHTFVMENNIPSQTMMAGFDAKRIEPPMYWRKWGLPESG